MKRCPRVLTSIATHTGERGVLTPHQSAQKPSQRLAFRREGMQDRSGPPAESALCWSGACTLFSGAVAFAHNNTARLAARAAHQIPTSPSEPSADSS